MKKIIFDLGNVLLRFHPEEYLSKYFDQKTREDLMIIIFCSNEWVELDLGNLMIKDVINIFSRRHPQYKDEITFVLNNWTDMMSPIQENVNILKELKEKGYHLYILSNFHREAFETMKEKYNFLSLFDGGIVSAYVHFIKPNDMIYYMLLRKYNIDPKDCLFIDDSLANIDAAKRNGIDGIHLKFDAHLKEELIKRKIL